MRQNIEAGAADLMEWLRRYKSGLGTDAELAVLLNRIESADGWKLQARINASASALAAPPLDGLVGPLSGGEKRRVALCRALAAQPDLLLLDEPTNHLDAESILWLEGFLREFPGAVIFVTHDRYFLDRICDQIVAFEEGGLFVQPGNYSYYLEKKKGRDAGQGAGASIAKTPARKPETVSAPKAAGTRKLSFKEQRELEGMEAAILAAEARVRELETTLNDPEFHATRSREAHGLIADLEGARGEVTRLYERWQELAGR
ncbi:MAG: ATP-binding cassette domain-containing protein [Verrucomicrobiota bacterium]